MLFCWQQEERFGGNGSGKIAGAIGGLCGWDGTIDRNKTREYKYEGDPVPDYRGNVESQYLYGLYVNIKLTKLTYNHHARSVFNSHSTSARTVLGHSSWIP